MLLDRISSTCAWFPSYFLNKDFKVIMTSMKVVLNSRALNCSWFLSQIQVIGSNKYLQYNWFCKDGTQLYFWDLWIKLYICLVGSLFQIRHFSQTTWVKSRDFPIKNGLLRSASAQAMRQRLWYWKSLGVLAFISTLLSANNVSPFYTSHNTASLRYLHAIWGKGGHNLMFSPSTDNLTSGRRLFHRRGGMWQWRWHGTNFESTNKETRAESRDEASWIIQRGEVTAMSQGGECTPTLVSI